MSLNSSASLLAAILSLSIASAVGCASKHHTVEPYRSNVTARAELDRRANAICGTTRPTLPPHPFVTDGCSMFPDSTWAECCVTHDIAYWCGGTYRQRRDADGELMKCVAAIGRPTLGWWMDKGVFMGGVPWMPTPWRWSYGWDWPTGYEAESTD
jgi:hypothetical protein